jgi:membrane associated rhomboid family serine protease
MFPLADSIPTERTPVVTYAILAACVAVWFMELMTGGGRSPLIFAFGATPLEILRGIDLPPYRTPIPVEATLVTSMFLHGGWMHLIGNMLYLWIFGNNVEDAMGRGRFILFYFLCGVGAAAAHILLSPGSQVPMVGASGAISGVLGAYVALYPHARVKTLLTLGFIWDIVRVPAWILLGVWFLLQTFATIGTVGARSSGVAFAAHFGGFLIGLSLIGLFKRRDVPFGGGHGY